MKVKPAWVLLLAALVGANAGFSSTSKSWPGRFEVSLGKSITAPAQSGRLFVILATTNSPEPRLMLGRTGLNAPEALARDVERFREGAAVVLDRTAFAYPITKLAAVAAGDYYVQALFDCNADLRFPAAPGNLYSQPQRIHFEPGARAKHRLELTQQIPPEEAPAETEHVKFVKIQSKRLSEFHGRPIYLRAGVILPRDYLREPSRRYPLIVRIPGLNGRYTAVLRQMAEKSEFRKVWLAPDTPQMIYLQLDGTGPNGDPYYVNSANNGPYGDAVVEELIPCVEAKFRGLGEPRARFTSGVSTGGWVCLGLQIFYPDFFNGAWASCPDPVDFRGLELVNIYEDDYTYVNKYGNERPSARDSLGDIKLLMRREVGVENLLGRGNCYTTSGEQWGEWTATFSPRGADGRPMPLWDPQTGKIDRAVAEQWKKYDLRLVLQQNWQTLGPKLRGKLHIAAGEADTYFLNNAVHLLDEFLTKAQPPYEGKIVYGLGKPHGWMYGSTREILDEMQARVTQP